MPHYDIYLPPHTHAVIILTLTLVFVDVQDNNELTGPIPTTFGALQKLEYLTFCKYRAARYTACFTLVDDMIWYIS